jgi:hypothetical protein
LVPCDHSTLFTQVPRRSVLGSPLAGYCIAPVRYRDLAAGAAHESPHHVRHEAYDDEDEQYLYWPHSHII